MEKIQKFLVASCVHFCWMVAAPEEITQELSSSIVHQVTQINTLEQVFSELTGTFESVVYENLQSIQVEQILAVKKASYDLQKQDVTEFVYGKKGVILDFIAGINMKLQTNSAIALISSAAKEAQKIFVLNGNKLLKDIKNILQKENEDVIKQIIEKEKVNLSKDWAKIQNSIAEYLKSSVNDFYEEDKRKRIEAGLAKWREEGVTEESIEKFLEILSKIEELNKIEAPHVSPEEIVGVMRGKFGESFHEEIEGTKDLKRIKQIVNRRLQESRRAIQLISESRASSV